MNSQEFITQHVKVLKPLSKKLALAYWKASISGSDEDFKEYEELAKELKKIFNNKEEFEKTKTLFSQEQDPITKRQLKILHNEYLSSQGDLDLINQIIEKETKVEQKFNKFRANLEGKELTDNDIKEILKSETDSQKLQAAWEASKKQGELVEKDMLEIIKLRNNLAKSLGFKNY
ncbi:MAG: M2 family metallopeptidase, partial [Nanoarchaeota archaeon]